MPPLRFHGGAVAVKVAKVRNAKASVKSKRRDSCGGRGSDSDSDSEYGLLVKTDGGMRECELNKLGVVICAYRCDSKSRTQGHGFIRKGDKAIMS